MKPTKKRQAEITNLNDWKKATDRITVDCQLEPLNPTRLSSCVGWDEAALITYLSRRDWLKQLQDKLRDWVNYKSRSEVELAVCRSMWKSYNFYVVILTSLIKHSETSIKDGMAKQPQLFNLQNVREGDLQYVKH